MADSDKPPKTPLSLAHTIETLLAVYELPDEVLERLIEQNESKFRFMKGRGRVGWRRNTWGRICSNENPVQYGHLEILENATGVPTGVLLTISHLYALERDGKHDELSKYCEGLLQLAVHVVETPSKRSPADMLKIWRDAGLHVPTVSKKQIQNARDTRRE